MFLVIAIVILFALGELKKRLPTVNFSPSGEWIAFTCWNGENVWTERDVYVIRPDGSELQRVTYNRNTAFHDWSPDGHKILVTVGSYNGSVQWVNLLYTLNADGSDLTLVFDPDKLMLADSEENTNYFNYQYPQWSPDGQWIAFALGIGNIEDAIYLAHPDGENLHRIFGPVGYVTNLQWLDSRTLFINAEDVDADIHHRFIIMDIETGAIEELSLGDYDPTRDDSDPIINISNDRSMYIYYNWDKEKYRAYVFDDLNKEISSFRISGSGPNKFNWSPDDSRIVFAWKGLQILDLLSGTLSQIRVSSEQSCVPESLQWISFDG